jgi:hypothetical protein
MASPRIIWDKDEYIIYAIIAKNTKEIIFFQTLKLKLFK